MEAGIGMGYWPNLRRGGEAEEMKERRIKLRRAE
jgi:hypothetical protein